MVPPLHSSMAHSLPCSLNLNCYRPNRERSKIYNSQVIELLLPTSNVVFVATVYIETRIMKSPSFRNDGIEERGTGVALGMDFYAAGMKMFPRSYPRNGGPVPLTIYG